MRLVIALLLMGVSVFGQTTPVKVSINWPPAQLVAEKYGPLPKWAIFGEVIGCNLGTLNISYGEGDVIAAVRAELNLQAFSRQDAFSLVSNSQSASKKNIIIGWIRATAKSGVDLKAVGLIGGGNKTGAGIVVAAEFVNIILPDVTGVLNLRQVIQYNVDGLQTVMNIPAGRCTIPASLLFAVPANPPPGSSPPLSGGARNVGSVPNQGSFTIQVPTER